MRKRNWGRIVNIASAHGLVASANKSAYVASKHGIVGLYQGGGPGNCHVGRHRQRDLPGLGAHPASAEAGRRPGRRRRRGRCRSQAPAAVEKQPSLQFTTPEQLGELAVFLCTPAADNIRGAAFNVDGGWAAQ
jgi:3-hydroxybutyrate dehydrogenase